MSSNAALAMPAKPPPRSATRIDVTVGRNVRMWRIASGLSQARLGKRIGVSFQQLQKYESGANRIPTGRLVKIAAVLGVPVAVLFTGDRGAEPSPALLALSSDSRSFRLAHAFAAIEQRALRLVLVRMVEKLAAEAPRSKRRRRRRK
jgi:transcriptional regulator with XRE-family HTH domain